MLEVIPAINCAFGDAACVEGKIKLVQPFAKWVHIDVADGKFTFNKTWADIQQFSLFKSQFPNLNFEVHLMVEDPEQVLPVWLASGVARVVVHIETFDAASAARIVELAKNANVQMMFSLNPETPIEAMRPYFPICSAFQVLAVHPGLAGQKFLPLILEKVKTIRAELPDSIIEVDGGINLETAKRSREAGASIIASASCIFESVDPAISYNELKGI